MLLRVACARRWHPVPLFSLATRAFSVQPTAEMIKQLRESTGAPILDCKKALQASGCDLPAAEDWLRKKGVAAMLKKVDRAANQGMIALSLDAGGRRGAIVEVRCSAPRPRNAPPPPFF